MFFFVFFSLSFFATFYYFVSFSSELPEKTWQKCNPIFFTVHKILPPIVCVGNFGTTAVLYNIFRNKNKEKRICFSGKRDPPVKVFLCMFSVSKVWPDRDSGWYVGGQKCWKKEKKTSSPSFLWLNPVCQPFKNAESLLSPSILKDSETLRCWIFDRPWLIRLRTIIFFKIISGQGVACFFF